MFCVYWDGYSHWRHSAVSSISSTTSNPIQPVYSIIQIRDEDHDRKKHLPSKHKNFV